MSNDGEAQVPTDKPVGHADPMTSQEWFLYTLRCADDTFYTGITTDLARRVAEHNAGRGARYTTGRRPVKLIGAWRFPDRSAAQSAEFAFKKLSQARKLSTVARERPFRNAPFHHDKQVPEEMRGTIRFCPRCGGLLHERREQAPANESRTRLVCAGCGRIHYRNAKPCAGALIVRDGKVLLIKRAIQPFRGHWDIPGGFLEVDEHPEDGVIREVEEETGLTIRPTGLFGFYMDRYGEEGVHCLNIYFTACVIGGQEHTNDEVTEIAWFGPDELPERIAFSHAHDVLKTWAQSMEEASSASTT